VYSDASARDFVLGAKAAGLDVGVYFYSTAVSPAEAVSEAEIIEAIRRPVGAVTLDGVKRRTRASMGRCQGGFCTPKIMKLLSDELGVPMEEICKTGEGSTVILGDTK